ncbi:30S ribosomal protein S6 [Xylanibacillus composti]|uniref:Small ribosomal subunit protein bS6 n=1 Tax=Xylanibacillus composti TaxID=1572762 RepID=A0A8J4H5S7_9BACL|nr:30S ribosomal protein S6 [Xylanibacillus composti]MDT9725201.1 30S ribosomal protein S6 [Xylanibacillus composti]GIQ70051.1 30S ribosomal protein S6 [Xylanibacillus composti]
MRKYEMMFIIRSEADEETVQAVGEKLQGIITNNGGTVDKYEVKGKRRLAYEINKQHDGIYVLVNFTAGRETVSELDRVIRISDEIIRHLIVQDVVA